MATSTVTLHRVEDREGFGTCGACGREGLRWVAVLSDGSHVGLECAKAVLGYRPTRQTYAWVEDYRVVAEHDDHGVRFTLWQHRQGTATRATRDGVLCQVGSARRTWEDRGWL